MNIKAKQDFEVILTLSEGEAKALNALVGYGGKAFNEHFLPVFYKTLGKHYMEPYEKDLEKLFENIRINVKPALFKIRQAKEIFINTNPNH